ncbi:MAG: redoxin domain-containing protein [Flavobacteriales bacterium]|nr:redoxin domain-containing protein [Flavobacteriales bacterium]
MRSSLLSFALLIAPLLSGQPVLLPSIGISTLPGNDDPVCTLPLQTPPITSVGRDAGETAADFTLYDRDGNAFNLHDALAAGKPVLMISASYTCPVFRNKVPSINSVVATYGDELTTVIIYTVEAHPDQDISPYFGVVNTGAQNISAGILYRQPTTYGERKDVLDALTLDMQIDAPIIWTDPATNGGTITDLSRTTRT